MVSVSSTDRDFYAVRPQLVLRAAKVFGISSSMLEKGAKRLHSRAVAILAGKEVGQWGRHQRSVIAQYCEYTQSRGSEFLLPWQELVENPGGYDGKEGISSRTGNRPLSTVVRLLVDSAALARARNKRGLSIEELSDRSRIPPPLLSAMESGEWSDVAESTALSIAENLDLPVGEIFGPIPVGQDPAPTATGNTGAVPSHDNGMPWFRRPVWIAAFVVLLAGSSAVIVSQKIQSEKSGEIDVETIVGSLWRVSIELQNRNIPIPEDTEELFANGGYLELQPDGVVGFNWIDPNAMVKLPETFSWQLADHSLTLVLDGATYAFALTDGADELVTLDTTRSFEMNMHRISLGN